MTGGHLSFLALDGLRLGRPPGTEEQAHLADCADCAGYLQAGVEAPALPLPAWLARLPLPARLHTAPARRTRSWSWFWLLPLAPAAVALALWLGPRPGGPVADRSAAPGETREKGAPVLRLFVKRGPQVFAWDGKGPVHAGDRLRLEVRRADYRFVSVAAVPSLGKPPEVLYQGPLAPGDPLLPVSFRVDDRGAEEVLSVLLGREPVPAELHALAGSPAGEARTWRQILVLQKQPALPAVEPPRARQELISPF